MRNLIAFLFAQRFFFDIGDVSRGKKVYDAKAAQAVTRSSEFKWRARSHACDRNIFSHHPYGINLAAWTSNAGCNEAAKMPGRSSKSRNGRFDRMVELRIVIQIASHPLRIAEARHLRRSP
jgi:hypothetical protein